VDRCKLIIRCFYSCFIKQFIHRIHPSVVLTVAHKVKKFQSNELLIRAGDWNRESVEEHIKHQDQDVASIVIHKNYQKTRNRIYENDVALLFLKRPVDVMTANVATVCLPHPNSEIDYSDEGNKCILTSWGKINKLNKMVHSKILKKIELSMMTQYEGQLSLRENMRSSRFGLHDNSICSRGIHDEDVCVGDGGSPLVCPIPGTVNKYYQAGLVSWVSLITFLYFFAY
jgi:plasma kallikrein